MYRKFIGTIAAASIAITALGAVPAQAQNNDELAQAIAAILGVAALGAIINERKDDPVVAAPVRPKQVHNPDRPRHAHNPQRPRHAHNPQRPRHAEIPHRPRHAHTPRPRYAEPRLQPKPLPRHVRPRTGNAKLLPANCLRTFDTRRRTYHGFPRACLERNFHFNYALPQHCLVHFRTARGPRNVFKARCMRREGYRLARR